MLMFHLVCIGWLFFRANTLTQAFDMLTSIALRPEWTAACTPIAGMIALYILPLMAFEWWADKQPSEVAYVSSPRLLRGLGYAYAALMLIVFPPPVAHEFIYFQF
jgi:hypothetical protein